MARKPNIILLLSDDHGWDEAGFYGHPYLRTPVLDEMAESGLRFDRFYAAAPVCSPTRCSLMTGRHPNRSGCFSYNYSTRPEEIMLSRVLKEHGYNTAHFGKWHLGAVKAGSPLNPGAAGFDEWLSSDNFFECNPVLSRRGEEPRVFYGEGSAIVVEEAIKYIDKVAGEDKPFFIFVCFGSPHAPYNAEDEDLALYADAEVKNELKHRWGEITAMDRAIGRLRRYLADKGLKEDTIFWYMSDNGVPRDGVYANPFKGCKGQLYEGGIRVISLLEYPRLITAPRISTYLSVTSDVMPTILELAGIPQPPRILDGLSLVPHLKGETGERPEPVCFWNYDRQAESGGQPWIDPALQGYITPTGGWRIRQFVNYVHPVAKTADFGGTAAIMDNRYKLLVHPDGKVELFDILIDPAETRNLAGRMPRVVAALRPRLEEWQASVERSLTGADYQ